MGRLLLFITVVLFAVTVNLVQSGQALAQDEAPCSAWIGDERADGNTVTVDGDDAITLKVTAPNEPAQNFVYLEFFGRKWEVDPRISKRSNGGTWQAKVPVDEYALWGVGLYKLVWESRNPEDLRHILCGKSAFIDVEGFSLATVTGALGAAAMVVGLISLTFTLKTTINEGARWMVRVVGKVKVDRDKEHRRLRLRPTLLVSQTLLGTLGGGCCSEEGRWPPSRRWR